MTEQNCKNLISAFGEEMGKKKETGLAAVDLCVESDSFRIYVYKKRNNETEINIWKYGEVVYWFIY